MHSRVAGTWYHYLNQMVRPKYGATKNFSQTFIRPSKTLFNCNSYVESKIVANEKEPSLVTGGGSGSD